MAWLRIGIADGDAPSASDRLLAELPLVVEAKEPVVGSATPFKTIEVGERVMTSRVPDAWRQGEFLQPPPSGALRREIG